MTEVFLLLGSNLGDREELLQRAIQHIDKRCGRFVRQSSVYETEPWGLDGSEQFLNQVVVIETAMTPSQLLAEILEIELELGRIRKSEKMESRVIDIDILFFGARIIDEPLLQVPHPKIPERRFTLVPLLELVPDMLHPVLKKSMRQLYKECPDRLKVISYFDRSLLPKY